MGAHAKVRSGGLRTHRSQSMAVGARIPAKLPPSESLALWLWLLGTLALILSLHTQGIFDPACRGGGQGLGVTWFCH